MNIYNICSSIQPSLAIKTVTRLCADVTNRPMRNHLLVTDNKPIKGRGREYDYITYFIIQILYMVWSLAKVDKTTPNTGRLSLFHNYLSGPVTVQPQQQQQQQQQQK